MFNVNSNNRKVVITFVETALLGKVSEDVLTVLIPSEFGIVAYKDFNSRDTKYEQVWKVDYSQLGIFLLLINEKYFDELKLSYISQKDFQKLNCDHCKLFFELI